MSISLRGASFSDKRNMALPKVGSAAYRAKDALIMDIPNAELKLMQNNSGKFASAITLFPLRLKAAFWGAVSKISDKFSK